MKTKPIELTDEDLSHIPHSPDWTFEEIDRTHILVHNDVGLVRLIQIVENKFVITQWHDKDKES